MRTRPTITTTERTRPPTTRYVPEVRTQAPRWSPHSNPSVQIHPSLPGQNGLTKLEILPGSRLTLACNGTGNPEPNIQWIVQEKPEDLKFKTVSHRGQHYLRAYNITSRAEFRCSAQNPSGASVWRVVTEIIPRLSPDWRENLISAEFDDGSVMITVDPRLAQWLGIRGSWSLYFTDDADLKNDWEKIEGNGAMTGIRLDETNQWTYYYIEIENPETGVLSPNFKVIASNWDANVEIQSPNHNDERDDD